MPSGRQQRLEADAASVRSARRAVREAVDGHLEGDALDRLLLCASETVTNAIEHGSSPEGWVEVGFAVDQRCARLRVVDEGRPGVSTPSAVRTRACPDRSSFSSSVTALPLARPRCTTSLSAAWAACSGTDIQSRT